MPAALRGIECLRINLRKQGCDLPPAVGLDIRMDDSISVTANVEAIYVVIEVVIEQQVGILGTNQARSGNNEKSQGGDAS